MTGMADADSHTTRLGLGKVPAARLEESTEALLSPRGNRHRSLLAVYRALQLAPASLVVAGALVIASG